MTADLTSNMQGAESLTADCEKHARMYMYIVWGACIVIIVPIQYLIVSIFKAYRDEIKEDGADGSYNELPQDDREAQTAQ